VNARGNDWDFRSQTSFGGVQALDQRAYATGACKIWVVFRGFLSLIRSAPARLFQPWSPGALRTIWKYSNVQ